MRRSMAGQLVGRRRVFPGAVKLANGPMTWAWHTRASFPPVSPIAINTLNLPPPCFTPPLAPLGSPLGLVRLCACFNYAHAHCQSLICLSFLRPHRHAAYHSPADLNTDHSHIRQILNFIQSHELVATLLISTSYSFAAHSLLVSPAVGPQYCTLIVSCSPEAAIFPSLA